ncbi:MAG: hypothetical protein AAGH19_11830, partial [Pseudomonadota bacterium]
MKDSKRVQKRTRGGFILFLFALLLAPVVPADGPVAFHRQYVDLTHGQIHVLSSQPLTRQA